MNLHELEQIAADRVEGDFYPECGEGWYPLVAAAMSALRGKPRILQVKEKFGGLRMYIEPNEHSEHNYGACQAIEVLSLSVCEKCGKPGRKVGTHWMLTRCEDCYPIPHPA